MAYLRGIKKISVGVGGKKMNKFKFSKKKYSTSDKVWYDGIYIGTIEHRIREKGNIDWDSLREDKTKKLDARDRWQSFFYAASTTNWSSMGPFDSKEDGARALLNEHRRVFKEQNKGR